MFPRIYADFHNLDDQNRIRLTTQGTREDLEKQKIELCEGMSITFYMDDADDNGNPDDLLIDGTVQYSALEKCWVALVDWKKVRHASETPCTLDVNGGAGKRQVKTH